MGYYGINQHFFLIIFDIKLKNLIVLLSILHFPVQVGVCILCKDTDLF